MNSCKPCKPSLAKERNCSCFNANAVSDRGDRNENKVRNLTTTEIAALEQRGCLADCWAQVLVADSFRPEQLTRVQFRSQNRPADAAVLDETGSRSVTISPYLTSQIAAMVALSKNEELRGTINRMLADGLTGSCYVGENVMIADSLLADTVVMDDTTIADGVILERCFVGEACSIEKQFSAVDSLFFANCQMAHGEACSVFAGPYTVSHHKSTLLIGGMYSFYNAGSNTNYSNHLYKRGPVHWGIMERGAKTASGAHIVWPARIGAFTMVMGKHAGHPDTTDFPFSYLIQDGGKSWLVPAVNVATLGTKRDADKWPKRDKRTTCQSDILQFDLFSPVVLQQIKKGLAILQQLAETDQTEYEYCGLWIRRNALIRGIGLYQQILAAAGKEDGDWMDLGGCFVQVDNLHLLERLIAEGEVKNINNLKDELKKLVSPIPVVEIPEAIRIAMQADADKETEMISQWMQNLLY